MSSAITSLHSLPARAVEALLWGSSAVPMFGFQYAGLIRARPGAKVHFSQSATTERCRFYVLNRYDPSGS